MRKLFILIPVILVLLIAFLYKDNEVVQLPKLPENLQEQIVPNNKVSFIVFGDSGTGSKEQKQLAQEMLKHDFQFILHTGDVAYDRGTREELNKNFGAIYLEHLKQAKAYPSPGNHDYQTFQLRPYLEYFDLPTNALKEKDRERYYSFDQGDAHFIALDTNTPLYEVSENTQDDMADWLVQDLEKSDKKWKVVYFHHPPYSSGKEHGGDLRVQQKLVSIFEKYNVDLVLAGHEHNYERTCKIKNGKCDNSGVLYIVTGGGGGPIYKMAEEQWFTAKRAEIHHFVQGQVEGCKFLLKAISITGEEVDQVNLDRCS